MVCYSFLVGLFHPRLHAGLSRRLRLLAFLDPPFDRLTPVSEVEPLLGGSPLIVKPYHRPARQRQVRYDEAYSGEQFPKVELHLCHDPPAVFQLAAW